jgi:hypothetical protein
MVAKDWKEIPGREITTNEQRVRSVAGSLQVGKSKKASRPIKKNKRVLVPY